MKDNMDALLENAYIPEYEPSEELNKAILEKACEIKQKTKKGFAGQLPKVAAVVLALAESGMDNWLSKEYEDDNCVTYVHTQAADWEDHELSVFFYFGEKQFSMTQMLRPGVDHTQGVHSLVLQNTSNKRTYTSKNGYEFVLVDEFREDEMGKITKTYVMISYGEYLGYFSFPEFTNDEIHQILDIL